MISQEGTDVDATWWRARGAIAGALAVFTAACGGTAEVPHEGAGGGGEITGAGGAGGRPPTAVSTGSGEPAGGGGGGPVGAPYPVVLAHGFFGFEEFAGADFATYFYGVKADLAARGEIVHTPAVDPFNSSEVRGAQLVARIEAILAETGHDKVNLIGHSQGGLDARVVAHERPDLVASVTTFATPHFGTPVADIAMQLLDDPMFQDVVDWIVQVVGAPLYDEVGDTTSLAAPMYLLSQQGIGEFNARYTDSPAVLYLSATGRSGHHPGGDDCEPEVDVSFVGGHDVDTDPTDALLGVTEAILDGGFGEDFPNDGLVRARDARWGYFLGCVPADHLDEIGHLFGGDAGAGNAWAYKQFYADVIAHLRAEGY